MNLRQQIVNFPNQLKSGVDAALPLGNMKPAGPIIVAGMGGSALPGRILEMIMPDVRLHEDYDLPSHSSVSGGGLPASLSVNTTAICISWSGNTEETVSAYQKAREMNLNVITITSGGKLAELAKNNATPLVLLTNEGIQPRMATGFMVGALFQMLGLGEQLNLQFASDLESKGQEIAKAIGNKTPLLYATSRYQSSAYFWKILLNENCKLHAFSNYFPRMEHNELAGFNQRDKDKFHFIAMRDDADGPRQNINLDAALAIMKQMGYNGTNVNLSGNTLLDKVFNNYLLGLWTSFYLAQELGVDPSDIKVIEDFKNLKNK